MKITPRLDQKITQAVQTSMRIEGYQATTSSEVKKRAKEIMEKYNIQVSPAAKVASDHC